MSLRCTTTLQGPQAQSINFFTLSSHKELVVGLFGDVQKETTHKYKPTTIVTAKEGMDLRHQGGGSAGLVLPVGSQNASALVVASQAVHTALDENEAELGVSVLEKRERVRGRIKVKNRVYSQTMINSHLAVALKVLAHVDGLLDQVVQILGQLGSQTCNHMTCEIIDWEGVCVCV